MTMPNLPNPKAVVAEIDGRKIAMLSFDGTPMPALTTLRVRQSETSQSRLKGFIGHDIEILGQPAVVPLTDEFRMEMN